MLVDIVNVNGSRFSIRGITHFKNYVSRVVAPDSIEIYSAYDRKDCLLKPTKFDLFTVNGVSFENAAEVQEALIGVLYSRATSGGSGVQSVTGPNVDNTDPVNPIVNNPSINEILNQNRLVSVGDIFRIGTTNVFTYDVGFTAYIAQVLYGNDAPFNVTVNSATEGFYRGDSVVLNADNDIVIIEGVESETNYIFPPLPTDVVEIGRHYIFGSTVSEPESPNNGDQFMRKQTHSYTINEKANLTDSYRLTDAVRNININQWDLVADGKISHILFDYATSDIFPKAIFSIENRTSVTIPLENNVTSPTINHLRFRFPVAGDYSLLPGEIAWFWFDTKNNKNLYFGGTNISFKHFFGSADQLPFTNSGGNEVVWRKIVGSDFNLPAISGIRMIAWNANTMQWTNGYNVVDNVTGTTIPLRRNTGQIQASNPVGLTDLVNLQTFIDRSAAVVVNINVTASLNRVHNVTANATLTDPTGVEGMGYYVNVLNGVATVGGVVHSVGSELYRHYLSGSWRTFEYVNEKELERFLYSDGDAVLGTPHTGDTLETVLFSIPITADYYQVKDWMNALFSINKPTTTTNSVTYRMRIGTTGTTADNLLATVINIQRYVAFSRFNMQFLTDNLIRTINANASSQTDLSSASTLSTVSINPSNTFYLTLTAQLTDSTEQVQCIGARVSRIKPSN